MKSVSSFGMLSLLFLGALVAEDYESHVRTCSKIYIEEGQVSLVGSTLWVDTEEGSVSPVAIYSDAEGSYFNEITLSRWTCWRCFWIRNPDEAEFCNQCGTAKPS